MKKSKKGDYICPFCGGRMEFEDEWEDSLICTECGEDLAYDDYGLTAEEIDEKRCSTDYYTAFSHDPVDIPEGCKACGGPYPDCMSSCSLFDD